MATALICGTPTPATTRVVQIEPGPMPTLTASAPASTSAIAASSVTMLPAITCWLGHLALILRTVSITPREWPCAVSTTITSTPASRSAAARSSVSALVPMAAPTRSAPRSSLQARGNSVAFWKSLTVIMPLRSKSSPTTSTFSMRCLCSRPSTSSLGAPSRTVTSRSRGVITADTGESKRVSKRRSRWVTMPTALPSRTTGTPEMFLARVSSSTSRIVASGRTVIGSWMMPLSKRFTRATCRACASTDMFLWMMPMPPSCAMAIARRCSVTVSIAADTTGRLSRMPRVSCVPRLTSCGSTCEYAGTSRTSSKVRASSRMRSMG